MSDVLLIMVEAVVLLLLPAVYYSLYRLYHWHRTSKIRQFEFNESVEGGAVEEPHPVRELQLNERGILQKRHGPARIITDSLLRHVLLVFGVAVLYMAITLNAVLDSDFFGNLSLIQKLIGAGLASVAAGIFVLVGVKKAEANTYRDLNLPVWRVQGAFVPMWKPGTRQKKSSFQFRVRNQVFWVYEDKDPKLQMHNLDLLDKLHSLHEREEVFVEYSPFSKSIWEVGRVNGSKNTYGDAP